VSPENNLDLLKPPFRQIAHTWQEVGQAYLLPLRWPGFRIVITETIRTPGRQAELAASGASAITIGFHNFGRAFDFLVKDEQGVVIGNGEHPVYEALGQLAESLGAYWGGRFNQRVTLPDGTQAFKKTPDYDHIEYRRDGTVEQLKARAAAGLDA